MASLKEPSIIKVIEKGYCIGCGACSAIDPAFKVEMSTNGEMRVLDVPRSSSLIEQASAVCPMGDAPDEDVLAAAAFPEAPYAVDEIGRYEALYAGFSRDYRATGGSGGLTRWMMAKLLETGEIDHVVQVNRKLEGEADAVDLFYYSMHSSSEEYLNHTSTSAYFPITLQGLFDQISAQPGVVAITALPCFARAIRAVAIQRPEIAPKIRFISGTICGSLKSRRYAEYLAEQMGVPGKEVGRINFRGKSLARAAKEKCVEVWRDGGDDTPAATARVQDLRGTNYGLGYFKYKGCDYCDDVLAETADVAFGDAWIAPYINDAAGTNVVVVRNKVLADVLAKAQAEGEVVLETLTPAQVKHTQAGGLRHRRAGLQIRMKIVRSLGSWTPKKRVEPSLGGPVAIGVQLHRMAIRRATSSILVPTTSPLFEPLIALVDMIFHPVQRVVAYRARRKAAARPVVPGLERAG